MVKKICLTDVCLSNALIRMMRWNDITVFEVKKIEDMSAKFTPYHTKRPWGDDEILEFVVRKEWILVTADKAFSKRYEYAILVSANCQKPPEDQLKQVMEQYDKIKAGNKLRSVSDGGYPPRGEGAIFIDAFGRSVRIPQLKI